MQDKHFKKIWMFYNTWTSTWVTRHFADDNHTIFANVNFPKINYHVNYIIMTFPKQQLYMIYYEHYLSY